MNIIKNIEVVSKTLPQTTNYRILNLLINNASWQLAYDNDPLSHKTFTEINGKKDLGFFYKTFDFYNNINISTELNTYANTIFDILQDSCRSYKLIKPTRYIWNYYNKGSQGTWHIDNERDPNGDYITAIYSLNSSDGCLEIESEAGIKVFKSNSGQAVIFHSGLKHRGGGPTKSTGRFNLAIIMELK